MSRFTDEIESVYQEITKTKDPLKKAHLINRLKLDYQLKIKDIATRLNTKSPNISNLLRIIRLPDLVLDGYYSGVITLTHLQIISRLNNINDIIKVYEQVIRHDGSTQFTEKLVFEKLFQDKPEGEKIDNITLNDFIKSIKLIHPEYKIQLIQTQKKATLTISLKGNRKKTTPLIKKLIEKVILI